MQIVANTQLVRNRVRLGTGFHIAALTIFAIGAGISWTTDSSKTEVPWISWLAIVAGMGFYALGQTQLRRWGPRHRQEEALGHAIRGLDDRYKMYAYLASSLPDYIVIGPGGAHVIVARGEGGLVECIKDRWRKPGRSMFLSFFSPSIGNPTAETVDQVHKLRKVLDEEGLADVPAGGLIVFTNPKVQLRIEGCTATVTRLKELKDVLKRMAGKGRETTLPASRIREVHAVFDRRAAAARGWR